MWEVVSVVMNYFVVYGILHIFYVGIFTYKNKIVYGILHIL